MDFDDQTVLPRWVRLLVVGCVGLLMALLATTRIMVPLLGDVAQFALFSPFMRAVFLIKILSPLVSFFLAGGWAWIFLLAGEQMILSWRGTLLSSHRQNALEHTRQMPQPDQRGAFVQDVSPGETHERRRRIATPPLFQLDPTHPWHSAHLPMTPLPAINPAWAALMDLENEEQTEQRPEEVTLEQEAPEEEMEDSSPEPQEQEPETEEKLSLPKPGEPPETIRPVTLTLLKQVRVRVQADDGTIMEVKLRGGENAIRLLLLAHIAWRKGDPVDRDKMLTYVLARGKRRDMTTEQLGETFDSAKRYLRQDLDRAVDALAKQGHLISQEVDLFENEPGFYRLHACCQVVDLEMIEEQYHTIQIARKEGLLDEKLDGTIPEWVVEACQKLIDAYSGDFIQSLIEKFPDECGAWVREPFTFYRDFYLDALLILAKYESALGKNAFDERLSPEQNAEQCRRHSARAAQWFYDYAMYAIKSTWDRKLKFAYRAGKDGERVIRAARAMRRCVVELGKLGQPDMIDQVYLAFKERMTTLSDGNWKPDRDTEADVADAKKTTSAYRFSSQITLAHADRSKQ
jgi:hypothetical protein